MNYRKIKRVGDSEDVLGESSEYKFYESRQFRIEDATSQSLRHPFQLCYMVEKMRQWDKSDTRICCLS